jgi:hypothetical protein
MSPEDLAAWAIERALDHATEAAAQRFLDALNEADDDEVA